MSEICRRLLIHKTDLCYLRDFFRLGTYLLFRFKQHDNLIMPRRRSNIYEKQTINHSRLLQIIQDEYRLNPEQKKCL